MSFISAKNREELIKAGIVLLSITALFVTASFLKNSIGFFMVYSEGDRVGQVVKLSEKGILWKTWEGGMGLTQSGAYVEYWEFSIDSNDPNKDQLVNKLQEAYKKGSFVRIHYLERYGHFPWRSGTNYWVKDVVILR